MKDIKMNMRS